MPMPQGGPRCAVRWPAVGVGNKSGRPVFVTRQLSALFWFWSEGMPRTRARRVELCVVGWLAVLVVAADAARVVEQGGYRTLDPRWSAKGLLEAYLKRRDESIAALAKENPRAAQIVARNSAKLTEDLSRRAMEIESDHSGEALVADINAAVGDAIETVRADPTQFEAVLSEFRTTLTELAENGMDADATATIIGVAERKFRNAAFR